MGETSKFLDLLKALAEQLPSLITMIACIVFALTRRQRHPKVSLVVIIGLSLFILHVVGFSVVYGWVPDWLLKSDTYDAIRARNVYLVLGLINNTFAALLVAVLLAAVFMQRSRDSRAP